MENEREWTAGDNYDEGTLPPDVTPRHGDCPAQGRGNFLCTRRDGHTGRHAAGDGRFIVAVWA